MEHIFETFQRTYPRLLQHQCIDNFPLSIQLTEKRRPKYEWNAQRAENYVKKHPNTRIALINNKIYLFDRETQMKLPMNSGVLNKPRIIKLNGNTIMSSLTHQQRNTAFHKYKDALRPLIQHFEVIRSKQPIALVMQLVLPVTHRMDFDVDNYSWPIYKNMQDLLVQEHIIADDTVEYINFSCGMQIVFEDIEHPKLNIYCYGN